MRTSLLDDAGAALRRITDLVPALQEALQEALQAPPGPRHASEAHHLHTLTVQLRSEAHGLATYAGAAAAVR